jgi:hypothetical protein
MRPIAAPLDNEPRIWQFTSALVRRSAMPAWEEHGAAGSAMSDADAVAVARRALGGIFGKAADN